MESLRILNSYLLTLLLTTSSILGQDQNNIFSPVTNTVESYVLKNRKVRVNLDASDGDDNPLTIEITEDALNGSINIYGTVLEYQPNSDFIGSESLSYRAFDGKNYSNISSINLYIIDAPNQLSFAN